MPNEQVDRIQAKLGNRIAMLVVQAVTYAHHKLHHVKHRLAMAIFHSISDEISDEVDTTLGPFLKQLYDMVPEDHPARPGIEFMHTASGQLKAIAGSGLQMSGLLGTVAAILNNAYAPYVYNIVSQSPGQLPDPGIVVQAFNADLVGRDEARGDLAALGIQFGWADRMLDLGYARPGLAEGIELLRRGSIDYATFISYMKWQGIPAVDADNLSLLKNTPVSVADAALAVLRGNLSKDEGIKIASENGYDENAFDVLIGNTGEPPGLMQLLEAFRRGFITQAELEKGILQSRYRNEWIPMLEKLRYVPMSTSDAARAVVQDQMNIDDGRKIADQNGLDPGAFDTIVATEGNPLSRTEMSELYNRGLVSKAQFEQAMRESRMKNKYNDLAFALRQRLIPEGTVSRAVRYGEISHADAVAKIVELGYSAKDAEIIVASGSGERLQTFKERVVSSIVTMYEDGVIAVSDATTLIKSLGYSDQEISYIVEATEFKRESHIINSVITGIKGKYLQHHITTQQASSMLDTMGIPSENRDFLIKAWTVEKSAFTRVLTPAQVVKAVKLQLITEQEGQDRLIAMGYADSDAALLIAGA